MSRYWSSLPFGYLYEAIQNNDSTTVLNSITDLKQDLINLISKSSKNETSRKKLESGKVAFSDGMEYELNQQFILEAIKLADELDLDELASAETLYFSGLNEASRISTSELDSAKAAYYHRREYILLIVSYIFCASGNETYINLVSDQPQYVTKTLLSSFKSIEKELEEIKQSVDRSRLMGNYNNPQFLDGISFRRDCLFKEYQILGEILYGYISHKSLSVDEFSQILAHVVSFAPEDLFTTCFLPGIMMYIFSIHKLPVADVKALHKKFMTNISDVDKLAESPLTAFVIIMFMTEFIGWCKKNNCTKEYEFEENVNNPMLIAISLGGLEQFMNFAAETSELDTLSNYKSHSFYNYRSFLQTHIPVMTAIRMIDIDEAATSELKRAVQHQRLSGNNNVDESDIKIIYVNRKDIKYESHFTDFIAPILSQFVYKFVTDCVFVLTHLRDSEEDSLLSSEDFDLDQLSENADLERFYLAIHYIFRFRPDLCEQFWDDKDSSAYGFLQWASRCNSPLITSTFCLVLSALASGTKNAIQTFNFLQLTNTTGQELSTLNSSSGLGNHFSVISWATIYESFAYYNNALSRTKNSITEGNKNLFNASAFNLPQLSDDAVLELGEDSIIFLAGFFQLISAVAYNSSQAREELLESDDFYLLTALIDFWRNNTPLGGSSLTVLSSLVGDNIEYRNKIWNLIDEWIFELKRNKNFSSKDVVPRDVFSGALRTFPEILGFATLVSELFKKVEKVDNPFKPYEHVFPNEFGVNVRKPGIWPYIEFLLNEVLVTSTESNISEENKFSLQLVILTLCERCLESLDPTILLKSVACRLKSLDNIVQTNNAKQFLQSDPGPAIMNFIYTSSGHKVLFEFASVGIDTLDDIPQNSPKTILAQKSLNILNLALGREDFYINELLPILRATDNVNYLSANIGTSGFKSLYEALLLRLPLIAHISLYCGSNNLPLAKLSLDILSKISIAPEFSGSENLRNSSEHLLINKSRLLTMYETVNESSRIRFAFIEQLEARIENNQSIGLKVELLKFINNNLPSSSKAGPSISHFLLGFNTRVMSLGDEDTSGTIRSDRSVLKVILEILRETLATISNSYNIDYTPVRICALCLEIILKLCKSSLTEKKILVFLRNDLEYNFFLEIIDSSKKIDLDTLWNYKRFEKNINSKNSFTTTGEGMPALTAFVMYRSLILQLLALEIHSISINGSVSLIKKYISALISSETNPTGSPRLLEFLDILEFKTKNMIETPDQLFANYDYEYIFKNITLKTEPITNTDESPYDLSIVDELVLLIGKEAQKLSLINSNEVQENIGFFQTETNALKRILVNTISCDNFKSHHLQSLHSWCMLVQVLISDGKINVNERTSLILDIFQFVIPLMNDYLEYDILYAEELISLCVSLHHTYDNDKRSLYESNRHDSVTNAVLDANRLFPMFKAYVVGIMSPQGSASIRSDLYVLANKYLQMVITNKVMITELMTFIRSTDQRLINTICNDSLIGEGSCKITSLILLESFIKVTSLLQTTKIEGNFILELMAKNNYLLLLSQKLKVVDELFVICLEGGKPGITIDTVLYELTVYKSCLYFLIRIAQTRVGAQLLLQCDIINIIKDCRFLYVDADIGFKLNFETVISKTNQGEKYVKLNLVLDNPVYFNDGKVLKNSRDNNLTISYYEILVPIFQLVSSIVISLGPQNETSIRQTRNLLDSFSGLITAVMKREYILEEKIKKPHEISNGNDGISVSDKETPQLGIEELSRLFTLLGSLVQ